MVCIQKAVDLLLDIAHLRITKATAVRNPLDRRRDILKTAQKLFFCAHFIAIAPAAIIIKCNAAVFADEDRLPLIAESICKCRPYAAVIYLCRQYLLLTFCIPLI